MVLVMQEQAQRCRSFSGVAEIVAPRPNHG